MRAPLRPGRSLPALRALPVLLALAACTATEPAAPLAQGPLLQHTPPDDSLSEGETLALEVLATDDDGVAEVVLWHQVQGGSWWDTLPLEQDGDTWRGSITVQAPGVAWWFRAADLGQPPAVSDLPQAGSSAPFTLPVGRRTTALPFTEDFETDSLSERDWWTPSTAIAGYAWTLTDDHASDGARSAVHLRGVESAGVLEDWLISPVLDLSQAGDAMVRWEERGAGVSRAEHALYASVGSRDPDDGDFVLVAQLAPPPEGSWGRAAAIDLSAFAGQPEVALGWYTQGQAADDWWVDAVAVTALGPDLHDPRLSWSPDPASPGDTLTVQVQADNHMPVGASGATLRLSLPEGGGSLSPDTVTVDIPASGSLLAQAQLALDPSWPDDSTLPVLVQVDDGLASWTWELDLLVGQPSSATVAWTQDADGTVALDVGLGDPTDPTLVVPAAAGWYDAGSHEVEVDLTDWSAWLPPVAGPDSRWFARIEASADGSLDNFAIDAMGDVQASTELPAFAAGLPAWSRLPAPAVPELVSVGTTPEALVPGADADLSLVLDNSGAATLGPLTARLVSDDPDLLVLDDEPRVVLDTPWEPGGSLVLDPFAVQVSAVHTDGSPLPARLLLDDGVDSWSLDLSLSVPWPLPRVVGLRIDDGGDGLLDADEAASLVVTVANGGSLPTFDSLSARLSLHPDSIVAASTSAGSVDLGPLAPDERADATFALIVGPGAPGDLLALRLTLDDGVGSWEIPVEIPLGEPPWVALSATPDAAGDAVDGYALDLVDARWRVVGDSFELELLSADDIDADDVFIEAWGRASGTPYSYYRWILLAGDTHLQGYVSGTGFVSLGTLDAVAVDSRTLRLRWDLADMALAEPAFTIGIGAGWCGPDSYFCDHMPDGWGYPYTGFDSGMFLGVEW